MDRLKVLQELIDQNGYQKYLEIGVHKGFVFLELKCPKKVAIDPKFQIDFHYKLKKLFKRPYNFRNKYFEMTSDKFFIEHKKFIKAFGAFDLVFVDGLHTFEGSLKDVLNSLNYLHEDGCVVVHDCFPPRKAAATPANSYQEVNLLKPDGWNGLWCGDVWKTIVYLKKLYKDELEVLVLDTDFGLGIIKPKNGPVKDLEINQEVFLQINDLDYDYLLTNPNEIIGLRNKNYLFTQSGINL
ncbi:class I SAM-dependent methyltransferase [Gramella lutea]|uniref:Class I SAM-dependent methyltransferase n=1 Tax=Christiangramia lutea TaxID=1607951 RepID=A0A9X1V269_9FLAO|nr:class I SAM-dependent methyltransferase [Christiangramia lutea]MCH4821594.1 class I SAM-dependent methyltransferase [Christiangramia lutea]